MKHCLRFIRCCLRPVLTVVGALTAIYTSFIFRCYHVFCPLYTVEKSLHFPAENLVTVKFKTCINSPAPKLPGQSRRIKQQQIKRKQCFI